MSPRRPIVRAGIVLVPFIIAIIVWWVLAAMRLVPELFLPSPLRVWDSAMQMLRSGLLLESIGVSLLRLGSGWVLGVLLATLAGWALGMVDWLRRGVQPLLFPLRFVEPVAWLSLIILWFGTGESSKLILLTYASFFGSFLYILTGVAGIDETKLRAAQALGASRWQLFSTVIVPSTVPSIISGARIGMSYSFLTIVTAEMMDASSGVGYIIKYGSVYMRMDQIFVGTILVGLLGIGIDYAFRQAAKRLGRRYFFDHI
ncbi:ABC transporter permease [Paenibacillus sp. IB182496]|uniref:ABC transporter permease n=1 Tax=Paenibacillus sabuli TaxID=2772509 RepID=A0A927GQB7_9BACL|nr:ABC transporter permease [Paenibacillus sabuli]MBD2844349.1 ABC transporter permease [Paenibacillus sabuli]